MRIPLIGGSYTTRSVIASAQRCINYYPEAMPKHLQPVIPMTHYQRPALVPVAHIGTGPIRGLFQLSNGSGWCVSGSQLFRVNTDWTGTLIGAITAGRTNPVSMTDNGTSWILVDGSATGWQGHLADNSFTTVIDPNPGTPTFVGADRVDFIDGFIVFNQPNTRKFGSTLQTAEITFSDPTNPATPGVSTWVANKNGWPDLLQTIIVCRHEILLIGTLKSEVWYDAGNALFPFAPVPGAYIEHGAIAKYSLATQDAECYWLSRSLQGHGIVNKFRNYVTTRISNHALEWAIREMQRTVGISDAIGFCYQMDGHFFYVLTFPAGDQTWVFDASIEDPTQAWHQEACTEADGQLHRHRARCAAVLNDINVVGDHTDNTIYRLDMNTFVDTIAGATRPLTCIRSFPHIGQARLAGSGQSVHLDGRRVQFARFELDLESGTAPLELDGTPAKVILRWSDDRGKTWGTDVLQSAGEPGAYLTYPQWLGLGMARDRVFEISHSIAGPAALQGAFVDAEVAGT